MPNEDLIKSYERLRRAHARSSEELADILINVAFASICEVLPSADAIDVYGDLNEDFAPRLRIQRILDEHGAVVFDVTDGHRVRDVEDAVDWVNIEYLDPLIDASTETYLGRHMFRL